MQLNDEMILWFNDKDKYGSIEVIEEFNTFYENEFIRELTIVRSPDNSGSHIIPVIQQLVLFRSKLLVNGYVSEINNKNPLSAALSLRGFFETIGTLALVIKKLKQFRTNKIESEQFNIILEQLYLGIKDEGLKKVIPIAPNPINALTLIDAADFLLNKKVSNKNEKRFRYGYERLSEVCHPNSLGYLLGHKFTTVNQVRFYRFDEVDHGKHYYIEYFSFAAYYFMEFFKDLSELLKESK